MLTSDFNEDGSQGCSPDKSPEYSEAKKRQRYEANEAPTRILDPSNFGPVPPKFHPFATFMASFQETPRNKQTSSALRTWRSGKAELLGCEEGFLSSCRAMVAFDQT